MLNPELKIENAEEMRSLMQYYASRQYDLALEAIRLFGNPESSDFLENYYLEKIAVFFPKEKAIQEFTFEFRSYLSTIKQANMDFYLAYVIALYPGDFEQFFTVLGRMCLESAHTLEMIKREENDYSNLVTRKWILDRLFSNLPASFVLLAENDEELDALLLQVEEELKEGIADYMDTCFLLGSNQEPVLNIFEEVKKYRLNA